LITNRGTTVNKHSWPLPLMIICNGIAATLEQCFLVYRYYGLSRAMLMTAFVLLMIIAHAASGTTVAVSMIVHPEFGHRLVALASTVAFSVSAAIDIFIPMLLIWELRKIKTTHAYTQSLIRRAMVNALSSGCIVALAEIFLLILFWTRSPYELLGCPTLAPFYPITVLVNLFVGQRRVRVPASSFKTANLTTLDSSQFRRSVDFHHDHDHDKVLDLITRCPDEENLTPDQSENKESDGSTLSRTVTP